MKKILKTILTIILIILLIIIILLKFNIPVFGYRSFVVISGSMEPAINIGDLILIKEYEKYDVGDIVTYKTSDYYVTHRIVEKDGDRVTTKGDANNANDKEFDVENIVGRYVCRIPGFGTFTSVIYSPVFLVVVFCFGIAVTIYIKD